MPINLPVSYFPEGSTTVFTEIWLHTDLEILSESCKLRYKNPIGTVTNMARNASESEYHKVASPNTSCLEAHAGFFRLLVKGIFNPYVPCPFDKKLIS